MTIAEAMNDAFLKWFHGQPGIEPERTNLELVAALCWHVSSAWHYTEHEVARNAGTTTTFGAFAEWLHLNEVVKPPSGRLDGPSIRLVTPDWRNYRGDAKFFRVQGWASGFHGVRQKLILFESNYSVSAHEIVSQFQQAKLASVSNSVFITMPCLVERFLAAVDAI